MDTAQSIAIGCNATLIQKGCLYLIEIKTRIIKFMPIAMIAKVLTEETIHKKYGHTNAISIQKMIPKNTMLLYPANP